MHRVQDRQDHVAGESSPARAPPACCTPTGRLYFRYQDGLMALVEATPQKYNLISTFMPPHRRRGEERSLGTPGDLRRQALPPPLGRPVLLRREGPMTSTFGKENLSRQSASDNSVVSLSASLDAGSRSWRSMHCAREGRPGSVAASSSWRRGPVAGDPIVKGGNDARLLGNDEDWAVSPDCCDFADELFAGMEH